MRTLLSILILTFSLQSLTKADDIRDFQIEGMSVGDSLLDHFSKEEIKKDILRYDQNNEFVASYILKHSSFKIYDALTLAYKSNDKNYIIHSIEGSISYRHNISDCYQKKDKIVSELFKLFKKKPDTYDADYTGDKSGKSKVSVSEFYLKFGAARVICYDIDEELSKTKGWWDRLSVIINSKEFVNFLTP